MRDIIHMVKTEKYQKRLMNVNDIAAYLSISVNTVRSWVKQKVIPYAKLNGTVRFDSSEINDWIEQRKFKDINSSKALDKWASSKN